MRAATGFRGVRWFSGLAAMLGCVLCLTVLLLGFASPALAEKRVALVVGNATYNNPNLNLTNPKNDAEDVAKALTGLGFDVVSAVNANKRDLDLAMARFARMATDADAALFFYAGHALQYHGRNYLMPTDAELEDEVSLRYQMMPIDDVRAALDRASGVKIMILDACRNNPIVESLRRRASGESRGLGAARGLARIDKTQGMVVAYATAADEVAADGTGRNSPFTSAFLKRLNEPGLEIEKLFRRVAADVNAATGGRQRPETYVSLLSDYYLNQADRVVYDKIKDSNDSAALRNFILKFPSSSYAPDAQYRIANIEAAARQAEAQRRREQQAVQQALERGRAEQAEQEKAAREAAARAEGERLARERSARDQAAREQAAREQVAREQAAREQAAREQAERDQAERERLARAEQERTKLAALDRVPAPPPAPAAVPEISVPVARPPAASNSACDRDSARLASLRATPSYAEIVKFERELLCESLRPQLTRLRESTLPDPAEPAAAQQPPPPTAAAPILVPPSQPEPSQFKPSASTPSLATLSRPGPTAVAVAAPVGNLVLTDPAQRRESAEICKAQEKELAELRAGPPTRAGLDQFEKRLRCERLRPQIARLRESLPPTDSAALSTPRAPMASTPVAIAPAAITPTAIAMPAKESCEQDQTRLNLIRASPSLAEINRFERELTCKRLQPQVQRLRESLGPR